jgi:hypothetical protein
VSGVSSGRAWRAVSGVSSGRAMRAVLGVSSERESGRRRGLPLRPAVAEHIVLQRRASGNCVRMHGCRAVDDEREYVCMGKAGGGPMRA